MKRTQRIFETVATRYKMDDSLLSDHSKNKESLEKRSSTDITNITEYALNNQVQI